VPESESREFETVIYEKDDKVARITFNRPERANTQSSQFAYDLDAALHLANRDYDVRVVILKGNGSGYSAGHDFRPDQMAEVFPDYLESRERTGTIWKGGSDIFVEPVLRLWEFPKPTIAQIHGYAIGAGTSYALLTDIRIASEETVFQNPLPQGVGLPGAQTFIEPWVFMNHPRAAEYLFTCQTLTAQEALEFGLLNRVVPLDRLEQEVEEMAARIAVTNVQTLMVLKQGLIRTWELMGMRLGMRFGNDFYNFTGKPDDPEFVDPKLKRYPRQLVAERQRLAVEEVRRKLGVSEDDGPSD
jgi:enoyl-CoA hydratase